MKRLALRSVAMAASLLIYLLLSAPVRGADDSTVLTGIGELQAMHLRSSTPPIELEEAHLRLAAELAALFADRNILQLDAPVVRVGGAAEAFGDESMLLPGVDAITNAILTVATY